MQINIRSINEIDNYTLIDLLIDNIPEYYRKKAGDEFSEKD
jgi:hypothetical protein